MSSNHNPQGIFMFALREFHPGKVLAANMFAAFLIWIPVTAAIYWGLHSATGGDVGFSLGLQYWIPYWAEIHEAALACDAENTASLAQVMWLLAALVPPILAATSCSIEVKYAEQLKRAADGRIRIDRSNRAYRGVMFFMTLVMTAIFLMSLSGAYADTAGLTCDELAARIDRGVMSSFVIYYMFWACIGQSVKLLFLSRQISRYH